MNIYENRRQTLSKKLADRHCLLIFSGKAKMCSEDESYPFKVNRNFYYLTGLEKEDMVLMIANLNGRYQESLFILPYDENLARWVGGRMSKEEASNISGIKNVEDRGDLDDFLSGMMNFGRRYDDFICYLDLWHYCYDQDESEAIRMANKLKAVYPALTVKDVYPHLTKMRLIKDDYEVACISQAINRTRKGIIKMMQTIRPEMNEMVMEGVFNFSLAQSVCNENAFKTIAASGERATVLHYSENNQMMKDGELFLCDLGATYNHYCADLTRTFPVNGKFTERQKEIYELVLNAQKLVEENARPGITTRDLNNLVVEYYKKVLPEHGLTDDVREYYFHGVSHQLGLDTHDVDLGLPLEEGMVITNEPGLYINAEKIGIRIENDLLITKDGCTDLAKDVIREVADIEELMNN